MSRQLVDVVAPVDELPLLAKDVAQSRRRGDDPLQPLRLGKGGLIGQGRAAV
jgi:hypothetical protein